MKLSFSLPPKSASKPKPSRKIPVDGGGEHQEFASVFDSSPSDSNRQKEFVTQFDPSKIQIDQRNKPTPVIPPKENEWRPYKKMKNIDLPSLCADAPREFEVHTSDIDPSDGNKYGLNLRKSNDESKELGSVERALLRTLKDDLERLPEDRGFEEFEDMPIEEFGRAVLAGYGWKEGKGIGKNAKENIPSKQYGRRGNREGLGYDSSKDVARVTEERSRERMRVKEVEERDEYLVGKDVRVIEGRDIGSKGKIVERVESDWVVLTIKSTEEKIRVRVVDIAPLGSREEERCLKKLKELKVRDGEESKRKREDRGVNRNVESEKSRRASEVKVDVGKDRDVEGRGVSWLRSHIRVRVISKDLQGGRFYLKKGHVVDVVGPYICDISMDEKKELIEGVDQDLLETALPRRGGPVLVLYGRHKGVYGSLVERDLDQETGVVRDADSQELLNVKLEQIAEYIGDPSDIGY